MSPFVSRTALALGLFTLVGCATTTFTSTWKAPDAQPVGPLKGKKVIAFVLIRKAPAARREGEDALARQISLNGAEGVAGYTLVDESQVGNEAQARAAVEQSGAVGVVVMRPLALDASTTSAPPYTGQMYGSYWGGYYDYGWGGAWTTGSEIRTDLIVTVETLVYSLQQNKLIWAGQSKTTNPTRVDAFVRELAVGVADEMKKAGLL
jgi:hypothetical protein